MPEDEAEKQGKRKIYNSKIESVIVSFSGGKDSQVVLDLVSRVIPPDRYYVIYSNTGYELPTSLSLYDEIRDKYQALYPVVGSSLPQKIINQFFIIGINLILQAKFIAGAVR